MHRAKWIRARLAGRSVYATPLLSRAAVSQYMSTPTAGRRRCREYSLFPETVEFVLARTTAEGVAKPMEACHGVQSSDRSRNAPVRSCPT